MNGLAVIAFLGGLHPELGTLNGPFLRLTSFKLGGLVIDEVPLLGAAS